MLISTIVPTFNRAGKVMRAIDSVLCQSYKDLEVIVVDDGSTDDTAYWIGKYTDPRLKYFKTANSGVAAARNFGVRQSKADWVCFLDSDDLWRRHKLSEQLKFHDQNRDVLFSQTDDIWIRDAVRVNKMKKHAIREGSIFQDSLRLCLVCCSSVMINKSFFWERGGFDEELVTCEDYDLWLRILAKHPVGFVKKILVTKFGGHEDQLSKKYPLMDKFRIYALEKLLKSGELDSEQESLVKEEIIYKRGIVERGAGNRRGDE